MRIKKTIFVIIFCLVLFLGCSTVKAASYSLTANSYEVEVGKNVTINVSFTAAAWNITVSGDKISGESYASQTSDLSEATTNKSFTMDTSKEGNYKVSISGDITDKDGKTTQVNKSINVKVNKKEEPEKPTQEPEKPTETTTPEPETPAQTSETNPEGNKSEETKPSTETKPVEVKLNSLKINDTTYAKYLKTSLSVTVENQNYVSLLPTTSDGSSCTITNNSNNDSQTVSSKKTAQIKLQEGTNIITIKGKFNDTYTVTVTNKKQEEETPPNVEEPIEEKQEKVILKSLSIKGIKINEEGKEEKIDLNLEPKFSSEVYEYTIAIPEEYNDILKLDIEAIGDKEEYTVEVTGNEELENGENIVTILVKSKDGETTTTYQIKVNKEEQYIPVVATTEQPMIIEEDNNNDSKELIKSVIVAFTIIVTFAGIVFAVVEYKYGPKKEKTTKAKKERKIVEEENFEEDTFASIGYEDINDDKKDSMKEITDDYRVNEEYENQEDNGEEESKIKSIKDFDEGEDSFEEIYEEEKPKRKGKHF